MLIRRRRCCYRMLLLLILHGCDSALHQNLITLLGGELQWADRTHEMCRLVRTGGRVNCLCLAIDDGRAGWSCKEIVCSQRSNALYLLSAILLTWTATRLYDAMLAGILAIAAHQYHPSVYHCLFLGNFSQFSCPKAPQKKIVCWKFLNEKKKKLVRLAMTHQTWISLEKATKTHKRVEIAPQWAQHKKKPAKSLFYLRWVGKTFTIKSTESATT